MFKRAKKSGNINLAAGLQRSRRKWRPWMTWTASIIGGLIVLLGLVAAYYYPAASRAIASGKAAVAAAKRIPVDLSAQKFPAATADVESTRTHLKETQQALEKMQGLRVWPFIGRQYSAVTSLIKVGDDSLQAMGTLVVFLKDVFAPFEGRGKVSLATISTKEKGQLLGNMSAKGEGLRAAQVQIHAAGVELDKVPSTGLLPQLADGVRTIKEQFPLITQALDQAIPATKVFPSIFGYPQSKTYLFLLENNTELRPGGGFIGTYGIMKVNSGEIVSLKTDNVYNFDRASKAAPIKPPLPIEKYLKIDHWAFRDSNWSPDFPTSAAQALYLYKYEGGQKNIDGVIAVTPTSIADFIKLVGPITVDGITFTSENFVDKLQYQVEQGYLRANIAENDRKDIIGDLTSVLMARLLNLPLADWKDLFVTISNNLQAKQILIWVNDATVQNIMVDQNWAGAIDQKTGNDYLMVADANLASLKTDQVMLRNYSYAVTPTSDGATATLTIHYQNTGKFDWKTTRYNTFVRVYVPAGSVLVSSNGAQIREKSNAPGKVETTTELGKTVFSALKSVEPGTSSDLVLTYTLPKDVAAQWQAGQYRLIWQKEPGMLPPDIHVAITGPQEPTSVTGVDNPTTFRQDTASFSDRLSLDRDITIHY